MYRWGYIDIYSTIIIGMFRYIIIIIYEVPTVTPSILELSHENTLTKYGNDIGWEEAVLVTLDLFLHHDGTLNSHYVSIKLRPNWAISRKTRKNSCPQNTNWVVKKVFIDLQTLTPMEILVGFRFVFVVCCLICLHKPTESRPVSSRLVAEAVVSNISLLSLM